MIYMCADDYGLSDIMSAHIQECIECGALNKVSVFPNFGKIDIQKLFENKNIRFSLHLNLVEGKCMADHQKTDLITDKNGNFKYTFGGLLKLSLLHPKRLKAQLYEEIRTQVLFWKSILPDGVPFCVDSHQHTHMIPVVFRSLLKVLSDEKITPAYMRIPTEPILPYIQTPALYFTYSPINIIKQWLLNFLWLFNKSHAKKHNIPTAYFFGILFSGKMDEKRVTKVLPKYKKLSEKYGRDTEVLFHPGYTNESESELNSKNTVFNKFYLSPNRKTEYECVIKISEGSV